MLTQYKNIDQINSATKSVTASRIAKSKTDLFSYNAESRVYPVTELLQTNSITQIELHVYSGGNWITGNHHIQPVSKVPEFRDKITNQLITLPHTPIAIDLYNEFEQLKLTAGTFKIAVNFFKNLIGDYDLQHLRIDDISPDRTELRLRAIDDENPKFLRQLTSYINNVTPTSGTLYKTYLLNFSRNQTATVVNTVVIGDYVYIKLYEPLDTQIEIDYKCWIVEEIKPPFIDNVYIAPTQLSKSVNQLANPNWQANYSYNTSNETGLKNWNDLLGSSVQTSQQIIDTYFSGSLSGVKLNIDYSDLNNFVFYSSATERLENFKYKLQLLEYYATQSLAVSQLSGSVATTNATDYETNRTNLISGFDAFEQYLYYQSGSSTTTYENPLEFPNVATVTGSYIQPVPKTNSTYPYTLAGTTSTLFTDWWTGVYASASLYDTLNLNALVYAVPEFVRFDSDNIDLTTFVNMLGHHYDILYMYINHMTKIHKREENPKLGMPNELLYSVAKQFGWNLTDGHQSQDLWQYALGTSEAGVPLTGSNTVGDPSVPGRDMTYAVWRRIVNNLPLLLKSKGTKRSVQALLSCYGIPQSMISINEYGGPRLDRTPIYEKLNFDYALDLINNPAGLVEINVPSDMIAIELRFRLDDVRKNPTIPSSMELLSIDGGSFTVGVDFVSGTFGTVSISGMTASDPIEMFDGGWISLLVQNDGNGNSNAIVKRAKYGKIVAEAVATGSGTPVPVGGLIILGSSDTAPRLVGQLQEFRIWSNNNLDPNLYFNNHVKAPAAYDALDPYNDLAFRLPLTQKVNHTLTSSMQGVQPVSASYAADFHNWSTDTPYDSIEEMYYYDAPSLGAGTYDDNKIRLESNNLVGSLDVKTRAERSQFDLAPLDSKKLGVYFSPQTMIDEDIIAQYGDISLDDYIGDPGLVNSNSYPALVQVAQEYWKKYSDRNDINAYINMFTLFDMSFFKQLEQLLPARTDKLTGILIQPNLLERSKATILPKVSNLDSSYSVEIVNVQPTASGDYLQYLGSVDGSILTLSGEDDNQWQMYLTASTADKYDGTPYSYNYLLHSGSGWITASSPYWLSEAIGPVIISSVVSEFRFVSGAVTYEPLPGPGALYGSGTYGSGTYASVYYHLTGSYAEVQDYTPRGIANHRYNGTKMSSPAFNIDSTQTIDGKPVVEWRTSNPNQLIYQQLSDQGSFVLV
jgi:hypothetical protein